MAETSAALRTPGKAIFLTGNASDVPAALLNNLKHNNVLHEKNVILTIVIEDVPRMSESGRGVVEKLSEQFTKVTLRFGFMESPNVPAALKKLGFHVDKASYFLSRRALVASAHTGLPLWQDHIFISLARSASDASSHFCIPEDRAVEVGTRIAI